MSYYGFTLQELRELMELRGEEAKAKERFVDIWIQNSKILEPKLDIEILKIKGYMPWNMNIHLKLVSDRYHC